jgi:hypothetical protein
MSPHQDEDCQREHGMWNVDKNARVLLVWLQDLKGWKRIERNNKIVWPTDTYGPHAVEVTLNRDTLRLEQRSEMGRTSLSDNIYFQFDPLTRRYRITLWDSRSMYATASLLDTQGREDFERRLAKDSAISGFDGYVGSANYRSGQATVTAYRFTRRDITKNFGLSLRPTYLGQLRANPFEEYLKSTKKDAKRQ